MTVMPPRDEPTKLLDIVLPMLGPVEDQALTLQNGCQIALALGALSQDDCAAYRIQGDMMLVAGSDYVRGARFRLYEMGLLDNYDIGWYLAGANWSDVAAMGAVPLGLLSVIRYPKDLSDDEFGRVLQGVSDCCKHVGALNIGGDIGGAERIILSASAIGAVEPDGLLRRDGAKPGDILCLTAPTGLAGAAMQLAAKSKHDLLPTYAQLLRKWRRVEPRIAHGRIFSVTKGVTSCVDTSDGLKAAVETVAARSAVRIEVDGSLVPVVPAVEAAAHLLETNPFDLVFGDSVDFELLCTVETGSFAMLRDQCLAASLDLIRIGRVVPGSGACLITGTGETGLPGESWRHQERPLGGTGDGTRRSVGR